jgi:hypothetical protein
VRGHKWDLQIAGSKNSDARGCLRAALIDIAHKELGFENAENSGAQARHWLGHMPLYC